MNEKELQRLHDYLQENIPGYISMIIDGSVAVGDVWVEGESDYDILLIFEDDTKEYRSIIKNYLKGSLFTDQYLFVPFTKGEYLKIGNTAHDFSRQFRAKTLFGVDVIPEGSLPSREKSIEIYEEGLKNILRNLHTRSINATFWSEEKLRKVFYLFFKRAFMYLAIGEYVKKGEYPVTRQAVSATIGNQAVKDALYVMENKNSLSKKEILIRVENFISYLEARVSEK